MWVRLVRCLRSGCGTSCGSIRRTRDLPFYKMARSFSHKGDEGDHSEKDALKERIMREIAEDPNFLRDVIRKVRYEGGDNAKIIKSTAILTDYILQADTNKDGVVTREEIALWVRRKPELAEESVRYIPHNEASANDMPAVEPTAKQIKQHVIKIAIPFVGFGFLDNVIMIISGSEIESYFGLSLGISAMAAAGLGNTLSDIVGIQAGGMVEALAEKMGVEDPDFTKEQLKSKLIRMLTMLASMIGITVGCLLGMFPLLFIDDDTTSDKSIRVIFDSIDADSSGKLELKELDHLFELLSQKCLINNPQQAREFMRSCGFDEQDSLTFDEFKTLYNAFIQKANISKFVDQKKSNRSGSLAQSAQP